MKQTSKLGKTVGIVDLKYIMDRTPKLKEMTFVNQSFVTSRCDSWDMEKSLD